MIALLTTFLFLLSLCARWITSAKARAKTVFGHLNQAENSAKREFRKRETTNKNKRFAEPFVKMPFTVCVKDGSDYIKIYTVWHIKTQINYFPIVSSAWREIHMALSDLKYVSSIWSLVEAMNISAFLSKIEERSECSCLK